MTSPKLTREEVISKYNLTPSSVEGSSPKLTREEVISKYNLTPSSVEGSSSKNEVLSSTSTQVSPTSSKEILISDKVISKKPKEIPKQNLSYKNYSQVFRSIHKDIHDDKKTTPSISSQKENDS